MSRLILCIFFLLHDLRQYIHGDDHFLHALYLVFLQSLNAAYDCLSDPRKKEIYDQYGAEASEQASHEADNGRAYQPNPFAGFGRRGGKFGTINRLIAANFQHDLRQLNNISFAPCN